MTSQLQSLSPETIHIMLMNMEESDILNYCRTHKAAYAICEDNYFWTRKLDHDFQVLYKQKYIIPSEYTRLYTNPNETAHIVYRRWKNYDANASTDIDADIIMFKIAQDKIPTDKEVVNIISYAIRTQNIELLNFIYQQKYNILTDAVIVDNKEIDFYNVLMDMAVRDYITVPILKWITQNMFAFDFSLISFGFIIYNRLDLLKWMHENTDYTPYVEDLQGAIMNGQIDIINWIQSLGVQPNVTCANIAAKSGNLYILQMLYKQGIVPDENGFKSAVESGVSDVIYWLYKNNITYPNAHNTMTYSDRVKLDAINNMISTPWNLHIKL